MPGLDFIKKRNVCRKSIETENNTRFTIFSDVQIPKCYKKLRAYPKRDADIDHNLVLMEYKRRY